MQKLVFIYNANSGLQNTIVDSAHKIFSPKTYECSLCDITYGVFTENLVWKKFRKNTDLKMEFLHKDEFAKSHKSKFGYKYTFPIVLTETKTDLEVFIKTDELNALKNAEELIALIGERLELFRRVT
ncbi:GTPase [Costertonia aggregata]|uniref:GTPase n=1 Tax=Costertonia aggregata TaxID=343403 RepID=A0A7H9AM92_9FLAO|nr:GTPase [Costertonia aggregata]QLG44405.1 GTPase [Costertonia aggregata]